MWIFPPSMSLSVYPTPFLLLYSLIVVYLSQKE
jgi:hypothetical protein